MLKLQLLGNLRAGDFIDMLKLNNNSKDLLS
jgi:hypothetical protein